VRGHHRRLRTLDQEGAQRVVAGLLHGLPLSGLEINELTPQSWRTDAVVRLWEVPSYSIERQTQAALHSAARGER
jgi:hypothetical protein